MNTLLSHNPNTEEPTKLARNRSWLQSGLVIINESTTFIALAAKEWLPSLIDQPTTPPFQHNANFQDEFKRVARLLVFVIVLSGIIVGSLSLLLENVVTLSVIRFREFNL